MTLNYIWPFTPLTNANEYNAEQFQMLMYRPLYMFGNNGPSVAVNYPLSLANAPVYSDGGKTVTITMKGWKWSNGESVDASDVVFWLNMMKAEPDNYYGYVPGLLPDNLASYSATGPNTVVLNLKSAVSSIWFTYNQLAEITPMPAAWDVTSASAKPGSGGCATDTRRGQVGQVRRGLQLHDRAGQEREDLRDQPDLGRRRRPVEAVHLQHRRLGPGDLVRAEHRLLRQPEAAAGRLHVLRVHR